MELALFLVILCGLLFAGVHVGTAMAITAIALLVIFQGMPLDVIASSAFKSVNSYALAAIPFFIIGGDIIMHGGLGERVILLAKALLGRVQGGLAICVILVSMFFAAVNGSSVATCAALGRNVTSLMEKEGYPKRVIAGLIAVGGTLGLMIPPSLTMILIGVMQGIPIVTLFTAGIVPGIMEGTVLALMTWFLSKKYGWGAPAENAGEGLTAGRAFSGSAGVLLMPVIILGGIYAGFFTPTEAAAAAGLYAVILALFFYRKIKGGDVWVILRGALSQSCMIYFIVIGGNLVGFMLTSLGISKQIADFIASMGIGQWQFLLMVNLLLLAMGMLLDGISMLILSVPVLFPIAVSLGINPIHLAVIFTMNVEIATLTPPVGLNLYVISGITKLPVHEVARGVAWFYPVRIAMLAVVTYIPAISLCLVS